MFSQLLTPVGDSLGLSFLVAILPVATVLVCLGLLRLPAWLAAGAGLAVGLVIAVRYWQMPPGLALNAVANGGSLRALAGHVDRGERAASLQRRRQVRPVRRLPQLGRELSSE